MKHHKLGHRMNENRNYIVIEDACFFESIEWVTRYFLTLPGLPLDIRATLKNSLQAASTRDYDALRGLADEGRSLVWKYMKTEWQAVADTLMMAFGGWSNGTVAFSKTPDEVTRHYNTKDSDAVLIDSFVYSSFDCQHKMTEGDSARYVKE